MSTCSADEHYSNIDCVEELQRLCRSRDSTISKLKSLALREKKSALRLKEEVAQLEASKAELQATIDKLEKQNDALQTANKQLEQNNTTLQIANNELEASNAEHKAVNNQLEGQVTRLSLNTSTLEEIQQLTRLSTQLKNDLKTSQEEVKRLSSELNKLSHLLYSTRDENVALSKTAGLVNALKADLTVVKTQKSELYTLVARFADNQSLSGSEHARSVTILNKLFELRGGVKSDIMSINKDQYLCLSELISEIKLSIDSKDQCEISPINNFDDMKNNLQHITYLLKKQLKTISSRTNVAIDNLKLHCREMRDFENEIKLLVTILKQKFVDDLFSFSLLVNKLQAVPMQKSHYITTSNQLNILDSHKNKFCEEKNILPDNLTAVNKPISPSSAIDLLSREVQTDSTPVYIDTNAPMVLKLTELLAAVPDLQLDMHDINQSTRERIQCLIDQITQVHRLYNKLLTEIYKTNLNEIHPPPPYTDVATTSTAIKKLETNLTTVQEELKNMKVSLQNSRLYFEKESSEHILRLDELGALFNRSIMISKSPLKKTSSQLESLRRKLSNIKTEIQGYAKLQNQELNNLLPAFQLALDFEPQKNDVHSKRDDISVTSATVCDQGIITNVSSNNYELEGRVKVVKSKVKTIQKYLDITRLFVVHESSQSMQQLKVLNQLFLRSVEITQSPLKEAMSHLVGLRQQLSDIKMELKTCVDFQNNQFIRLLPILSRSLNYQVKSYEVSVQTDDSVILTDACYQTNLSQFLFDNAALATNLKTVKAEIHAMKKSLESVRLLVVSECLKSVSEFEKLDHFFKKSISFATLPLRDTNFKICGLREQLNAIKSEVKIHADTRNHDFEKLMPILSRILEYRPHMDIVSAQTDAVAIVSKDACDQTNNQSLTTSLFVQTEFEESVSSGFVLSPSEEQEKEDYFLELQHQMLEARELHQFQLTELNQHCERQAEDYDRLVRDKEAEISQLKETADRLSDENDQVVELRQANESFELQISALKLITEQVITFLETLEDTPQSKISSFDLPFDDIEAIAGIIDRLNAAKKRSSLFISKLHQTIAQEKLERKTSSAHQSTMNLELVDHVNAIDELKAELAVSTEVAARTATLEKINQKLETKVTKLKQLLVKARREANEQERQTSELEARILEMEVTSEKAEVLKGELKQMEERRATSEAESADLKRELTTMNRQTEVQTAAINRERYALNQKLSKLQKDFDEYKVKAIWALRSNSVTGEPTTTVSTIPTSTTWRDEANSLALADAGRLRGTVTELEMKLEEAGSRLSIVSSDAEATRFALADRTDECERLRRELTKAQSIFREEIEVTKKNVQLEASRQISSLEALLEEERKKHTNQLFNEIEALKFTFCARFSELEKQLATAISLAEDRRQQLLEINNRQSEPSLTKNTCFKCNGSTPDSHAKMRTLQSNVNGDRSTNLSSNTSIADLKLDFHPTPTLEQVLFGDGDGDQSVNGVNTDVIGTVSLDNAPSNPAFLQSTVDALRRELTDERLQGARIRSLLGDSEITVERLTEQARVLKEEIRRYERNMERNSQLGFTQSPVSSPDLSRPLTAPLSPTIPADISVARNEYLKNIVVKFFQLPASATGERLALLPVLTMLLALSPGEREILERVAQSGSLLTESMEGVSSGQNWSSYLASWTGLG